MDKAKDIIWRSVGRYADRAKSNISGNVEMEAWLGTMRQFGAMGTVRMAIQGKIDEQLSNETHPRD